MHVGNESKMHRMMDDSLSEYLFVQQSSRLGLKKKQKKEIPKSYNIFMFHSNERAVTLHINYVFYK